VSVHKVVRTGPGGWSLCRALSVRRKVQRREDVRVTGGGSSGHGCSCLGRTDREWGGGCQASAGEVGVREKVL